MGVDFSLTNGEKQAILSGFIGDGSPAPAKTQITGGYHGIVFSYGEKQKEHAKFKAELLHGTFSAKHHVDGYLKDGNRFCATGRLTAGSEELYNMVFKNGQKEIQY